MEESPTWRSDLEHLNSVYSLPIIDQTPRHYTPGFCKTEVVFPGILGWTPSDLEGVPCSSGALNWDQGSLSCPFLSVYDFGRTPNPELSLVSLWGWMCVMEMGWAGTVPETKEK